VTPVQSSARNTSALPAQSVSAQGGNVTEINIQALTQTTAWQGYYGAVSGRITLDNGLNQTFYNWSLTAVRGEVYASRNATIVWSRVNCSNNSQRNAEDTYIGRASTDSDSVVNTFNLTTHTSFGVGGVTIAANSCYSTFGFVSNQTQATNWSQVLLNDNVSTIYSTIINQSTKGFDGVNHDFQLLVAENENAGNIGTTPYYFWVELT
jgi:hypothetical protein